jgi:uncharacterized protein YgiM (DUF1202 family)
VAPEMTILINQGAYPAAVNSATQMLNAVVDQLKLNLRTKPLEGFALQEASLRNTKLSLFYEQSSKRIENHPS